MLLLIIHRYCKSLKSVFTVFLCFSYNPYTPPCRSPLFHHRSNAFSLPTPSFLQLLLSANLNCLLSLSVPSNFSVPPISFCLPKFLLLPTLVCALPLLLFQITPPPPFQLCLSYSQKQSHLHFFLLSAVSLSCFNALTPFLLVCILVLICIRDLTLSVFLGLHFLPSVPSGPASLLLPVQRGKSFGAACYLSLEPSFSVQAAKPASLLGGSCLKLSHQKHLSRCFSSPHCRMRHRAAP